MQIKTPCCKLYLQQGAEKQIEQLSVSFIRTIPSAPESHRISGCINSRSRACGNAIYRRWGIAPRPETDFLALSIAQVLQIARGCAIIDKNKFGDWVVFPCCLVHSGGLGQHRTIPALRLKHRSGSCGTASALPKCSIMSGCGTRIVLRGQKPLLRPLPLLRFAVSATGGAHLCSIQYYLRFWLGICRTSLAVSALRIMRYCLRKWRLQWK